MIFQIDTQNCWVGFKPDNAPDSFLIYGGINQGQFHSKVILSSGLEKVIATMQIKQHEQLQHTHTSKNIQNFFRCTGTSHS